MPIARIEVRRNRPPGEQQYLLESVHAALMEAFRVPERDRLIRYVEHHPDHFIVPPGATDNYTLVEISAFPGRSLEAKRKLYREIVSRFGAVGIDPQDIRIILYEVPLENWGIRGGVPASEVDLGFKVTV